MLKIDREIYFNSVRQSLFGGTMTQSQVDGQEAILSAWEQSPPSDDLRHLAYCLATTLHETAATMRPIEEYGKGEGSEYGERDPETGQTYYGRGYVQLTWRDNYYNATSKLHLRGDDDLEWNADRALDPLIAADVMFRGMMEGWFRPPNTLPKFFNDNTDDAVTAREIINGDKHVIPDWSGGISIGNLVAEYHRHFLDALTQSAGIVASDPVISITIDAPEGFAIVVNGKFV